MSVRDGEVRLKAKSLIGNSAHRSALADVTPYIGSVLKEATAPSARLTYAHQLCLRVDSEKRELIVTERVVELLSAAIAVLQALPEARATSTNARSSRTLHLAMTLVTGTAEKAAERNEKSKRS